MQLTNLRRVTIKDDTVDELILNLGRFPKLETLIIGTNQAEHQKAIARVVPTLLSLQTVKITADDIDEDELRVTLESLITLHSAQEANAAPLSFEEYEKLSLSERQNLPPKRMFTSLAIEYTQRLTDTLAQYLPQLSWLTILELAYVDEASLSKILSVLPSHFHQFSIWGRVDRPITLASQLWSERPNLQVLKVAGVTLNRNDRSLSVKRMQYLSQDDFTQIVSQLSWVENVELLDDNLPLLMPLLEQLSVLTSLEIGVYLHPDVAMQELPKLQTLRALLMDVQDLPADRTKQFADHFLEQMPNLAVLIINGTTYKDVRMSKDLPR